MCILYIHSTPTHFVCLILMQTNTATISLLGLAKYESVEYYIGYRFKFCMSEIIFLKSCIVKLLLFFNY